MFSLLRSKFFFFFLVAGEGGRRGKDWKWSSCDRLEIGRIGILPPKTIYNIKR
jgi:hypothetical protein